jgi:hypothetical protein
MVTAFLRRHRRFIVVVRLPAMPNTGRRFAKRAMTGSDADASTTHRQQAIIVRNVRGRSGRESPGGATWLTMKRIRRG